MRRLLFVALVACSKPVAEPGSCFHPLENSCTEYGPANARAAKRMCRPSDWRPGEHTCPAGSIGTCRKGGGGDLLYPGPPNNYTAASAKSACEFAQGTFTPP